jgi:serine/threonine-protein kinase RsbT
LTNEDATRSRIGSAEAARVPERVEIACAADIVTARERGRALAGGLGFGGSDLTIVATVISELARNIIEYATTGTIMLETIERNGRAGLGIQAVDQGPGIEDIARALSAGSPTGSGLGLGLSGVRRMVDEFEVASRPGQGTTVTVRKWLP